MGKRVDLISGLTVSPSIKLLSRAEVIALTRPSKGGTAKCIFCDGQPTTDEHIWPRWSHRFIPKGKRKWQALHAVQYRDRSTFKSLQYPGDPHDWQVKCVDERCNNGWMKNQEDKMRPLFVRMLNSSLLEPTRLSEKDQTTIAIWFAIKAIVQEYEAEGDRIAHHTQRRRLWMQRRLPEKTWRVWIGRYDGATPEALWVSYPFQLVPDTVAKRRKTANVAYYNSQVVSYVLGKLFILLIRSPDEVFIRMWRHPRSSGTLRQIWPPTGYSFLWPFQPLTDAQAQSATMSVRDFLVRSARKHAGGRRIPSL